MTIVGCVLLIVVVWWGVEATEHLRAVVGGLEAFAEDVDAWADAWLRWIEGESP